MVLSDIHDMFNPNSLQWETIDQTNNYIPPLEKFRFFTTAQSCYINHDSTTPWTSFGYFYHKNQGYVFDFDEETFNPSLNFNLSSTLKASHSYTTLSLNYTNYSNYTSNSSLDFEPFEYFHTFGQMAQKIKMKNQLFAPLFQPTLCECPRGVRAKRARPN